MDKNKLKKLAQDAIEGNLDSMLISQEGQEARTKQEEARAVSDRAMEALVLAREIFVKDCTLDPNEIIQLAGKFVDAGKEFFAKELEPFKKKESKIELPN